MRQRKQIESFRVNNDTRSNTIVNLADQGNIESAQRNQYIGEVLGIIVCSKMSSVLNISY